MKFLLALTLIALTASVQSRITLSGIVRDTVWPDLKDNILTLFPNNITETEENTGCGCVTDDPTGVDPDEAVIDPDSLPPNTNCTDIGGVYIKDKKWPSRRFPIFGKRFPKLKGLEIDGCEIESLNSRHFRGLIFLVYVSFPRNNFKTIPGRTFRLVPQLQFVKFHGNKFLKNLGFYLFRHLRYIKGIEIKDIGCDDGSTGFNTTDVTTLTRQLFRQCPPDPDDLEEDLENMTCEYDENDSGEFVSGEDTTSGTIIDPTPPIGTTSGPTPTPPIGTTSGPTPTPGF